MNPEPLVPDETSRTLKEVPVPWMQLGPVDREFRGRRTWCTEREYSSFNTV